MLYSLPDKAADSVNWNFGRNVKRVDGHSDKCAKDTHIRNSRANHTVSFSVLGYFQNDLTLRCTMDLMWLYHSFIGMKSCTACLICQPFSTPTWTCAPSQMKAIDWFNIFACDKSVFSHHRVSHTTDGKVWLEVQKCVTLKVSWLSSKNFLLLKQHWHKSNIAFYQLWSVSLTPTGIIINLKTMKTCIAVFIVRKKKKKGHERFYLPPSYCTHSTKTWNASQIALFFSRRIEFS